MEGADILDLVDNAAGLLQQQLNMRAILTHDVHQVAASLVQPVAVEVHLIGEQLAVQCDEGTEGVGGEQHAIGQVEGDHGLGPVDHGGCHEGDGMTTEAVGVTLHHDTDLVVIGMETELAHQHEALLGRDDLHLGPAGENEVDAGGVVGLEVVDNQPVEAALTQQILQILHHLAADGPVHGVEQHRLLIQQQVGVIADPLGDGMNIFKQMGTVIVGADPVEIVSYFTNVVHISLLLSFHYASMNSLLPSEHSGQTQSSGSFSKRVPGAISPSSSPSAGS